MKENSLQNLVILTKVIISIEITFMVQVCDPKVGRYHSSQEGKTQIKPAILNFVERSSGRRQVKKTGV